MNKSKTLFVKEEGKSNLDLRLSSNITIFVKELIKILLDFQYYEY
jgi:hypothetical protein